MKYWGNNLPRLQTPAQEIAMKAHELLYDAVSYAKSPAKQYRSQKTSWQQLAEALPRLATAISQFNKGARIYRGLNRLEPILFK
ncbi:MAG: hypothetical protein ACO22R_09305, partial [Chitinophagaceae bacterium]